MANSPYIVDVTEANFNEVVIQGSQRVPVVVDFWAPWCGPCKALGPTLEALAIEGKGAWILAKVNSDDNLRLVQAFRVQGIPAVKAVVGGKVVDEFTGAMPRPQLVEWLARFVPALERGPTLEDARALEAEGALDEARAMYEAILASDPQQVKAIGGLARISIQRGDLEGARQLVDAVPAARQGEVQDVRIALELSAQLDALPDRATLEAQHAADPSDLQVCHDLAMRLAQGGDYERAFALLLEIVKRDRSFKEDLGREAMIKLFALRGHADPLTITWQGHLGRAMYV